jgi:hypothetical protein
LVRGGKYTEARGMTKKCHFIGRNCGSVRWTKAQYPAQRPPLGHPSGFLVLHCRDRGDRAFAKAVDNDEAPAFAGASYL